MKLLYFYNKKKVRALKAWALVDFKNEEIDQHQDKPQRKP